jgi:hypothetical protein
LGDFDPDGLDSRSLRTLWEWENRVLLEEYCIFNVAIPRGSLKKYEKVGGSRKKSKKI